MKRYSQPTSFDEQPIPALNSEVIDFRAASEYFTRLGVCIFMMPNVLAFELIERELLAKLLTLYWTFPVGTSEADRMSIETRFDIPLITLQPLARLIDCTSLGEYKTRET